MQLDKSVNNIEEYKDKSIVKGYVRVQAAGFEEQLVPITIYIQNEEPAFIVDGGRKLLNQKMLMEEPSMNITLSEKRNRTNTVSVGGIQSVEFDESSNYYQTASSVISSVSVDNDAIRITWNTNEVKVKTYHIPLLVTTEEYVDVPITVEAVVQKESAEPKVKLDSTILMLNRNYPNETASTGIRSINQSNVKLIEFKTTPYAESLLANKDTAVSLDYDDEKECLVASIKPDAKPSGSTYMFRCVPLYEGGIVSNQEITVTVKIHEKQAAVSVTGNGSIDVLRRDETAVVYTVNKINFTDRIEEVTLIAPEKTSSTVYDGSDAFTYAYDEEKGTITVKAKDGYKFIKGKKYAFRFEIHKENGLNGSATEASKTLLTGDVSIRPTQSAVRFTVDQIPAFFRYVSSQNNTHSLNLRTNVGAITKVELNEKYPLPEGFEIQKSNTLDSMSYDGVNYYSIQSGMYTCRLYVYMDGALCNEVNGEIKEEPIPCQVKYRVY